MNSSSTINYFERVVVIRVSVAIAVTVVYGIGTSLASAGFRKRNSRKDNKKEAKKLKKTTTIG